MKKQQNNKKNNFVSYSKFKSKLLNDPEVKKTYDDLEFEFQVIRALIDARVKKNMTQKKLAQKIGVAQSALARFESGRVNPTLSFLKKVTGGLGLKLTIK